MNPIEGFPTVDDCKPGLWVELTDGWIVGPIVETEFAPSVYVKFANGVWQLDVVGDSIVKPPDINSPRLVRRVGTKEELMQNLDSSKETNHGPSNVEDTCRTETA